MAALVERTMSVCIPVGARCLPPAKARAKFGKGNTWLWEKVRTDPDFPKPIYLGPKSPVFIEQHLDEYIAKCAARTEVQQ